MTPESLPDLHARIRRSPEYAVHDMMDQVRYQLRRRMEETGTTQAALALAMGVKPPVVSRLLRAAENTSLLTIARAARALGLTFTALKFVPDADADLQMDEFGPFLRSEGRLHAWWPRTNAPGAAARRQATHFRSGTVGPGGLGYTAPAYGRRDTLATPPRPASLDAASLEPA